MFSTGQYLGEFEVLELLGQGGMGAVYKARQVSLERFVALKTLQGTLASDPEYIARFRREAKAAAALNHPNLVQVYAAGETEGMHWFAMEYVEGESAQARLKRKGRLDPAEAVAIVIHIATALEYGWRKAQLIHRDVKPDNIFLSSDGEVKLGDLGLAKCVEENQSLTTTGTSMGTPHYVSPEQAEGSKDVDLRADIYSLGCTLFHLLSGEPPFQGSSAMAVMLKHVTAPVPELCVVWPECPEELSGVVRKMMQKQPADRQQSQNEVIADLRGAYRAFTDAPVPAQMIGTQRLPVDQRLATTVLNPTSSSVVETRRSSKKPVAIVALLAGVAVLAYFAPWEKSAAPKPSVSYAGTWKSVRNENLIFILQEDHTGIKIPKGNSEERQTAGTWSVDKDGAFKFLNEGGGHWVGKFSDDGKVLNHPKSGDELRREPEAPAATPAPVVAANTGKIDPAKAGYVGTWTGRVGRKTFVLKEDHTAVKTEKDGQSNGTWEIVDGNIRVKWAEGTAFNGKLSEDGQSINSDKSEMSWVRRIP